MDRVERMGEVIKEIIRERSRQEEKWGEQNHDPFVYLSILMEEVGEAAQAALQTRYGGKLLLDYRQELVHCAAVAIAAVECLDRYKWQWGGHALPHLPQPEQKDAEKDASPRCIGRGREGEGCGFTGGNDGDTCPKCGGMILSKRTEKGES